MSTVRKGWAKKKTLPVQGPERCGREKPNTAKREN